MLTVLRRPGVGYLLATSLVGRLPLSMSALALVRLVRDNGGSFAFASALSALYILAGTVGQPVLARAVDRTGRRREVLVGAAVLAAAGFVTTALALDVTAVALVAVAVAGLATAPIEPALRSLWRELFADPRELGSAYAVDAAAQEVAFIVGPLATALGIAVLGVGGNVVWMAALGLLGGVLFAAHPRLRSFDVPAGAGVARHGSPLASAALRRILLTVVGVAVPVGALAVLATAYAGLQGRPGLGPWAVALTAAGALAGAVALARWPLPVPPHRAVRPLVVLLAVSYLPLAGWALPVAGWLLAAFVSGLALPPLLAQVFAQTPRAVPERHANEANAWVVSAFAVGAATGTVLAGLALDVDAARGIGAAVVLAVGLALAGAVAAVPGRLEPG